eukprot:g66418.t1
MGSPGLGPRASDPQGKEEATGRAVRRSSPSSSPEGRMHWLGFGSGEAETDNKGPSASPEARMHWLGFGSREAETDNKGPSASLGRSPLNSRRWLVRDAAETKEMDESAEGEKEVSGAFERTTRQRGFMSRFVDASKETRDEDEECEFSQEAEEDNEDTWTRRSVRWQCFCGTTALCWIRTRQEYAAWVRLLGQSLAYWSKAVLLVAVVMYLGFLLQGFLVLCTSFATWRVKEKETYFVRALSFTSLLATLLFIQSLELTNSSNVLDKGLEVLLVYATLSCMALISTAYAPFAAEEERVYTTSFAKLRKHVLQGQSLTQDQLALLCSVLFSTRSTMAESSWASDISATSDVSSVDEEKSVSLTAPTAPPTPKSVSLVHLEAPPPVPSQASDKLPNSAPAIPRELHWWPRSSGERLTRGGGGPTTQRHGLGTNATT